MAGLHSRYREEATVPDCPPESEVSFILDELDREGFTPAQAAQLLNLFSQLGDLYRQSQLTGQAQWARHTTGEELTVEPRDTRGRPAAVMLPDKPKPIHALVERLMGLGTGQQEPGGARDLLERWVRGSQECGVVYYPDVEAVAVVVCSAGQGI